MKIRWRDKAGLWTLVWSLAAGPVWARYHEPVAKNLCHPDQEAVIASEHLCVQNGGIDIGGLGFDGMKVACLKDRRVQGACGPDGSLTRQYAFADWLGKLKQFQEACDSEGGTFSFQDPRFAEPQDPSYCLPAEPQIDSNMFEEPLCNFRSICPAVSVQCNFTCQAGLPTAMNIPPSPGTDMAFAGSEPRH